MKKIRCIAAVLSVTVIMSVCAAPANAETDSSDASAFVQEGSYSDYIAEYDDYPSGETDVALEPADSCKEAFVSGKNGIIVSASHGAVFTVTLNKSGKYRLSFCYCPTDEEIREIEYTVYLDGIQPFDECETLTLRRIFSVDGEKYKSDASGNQYIPDLKNENIWRREIVADSAYYYYGGFEWALEAGTHSFELKSLSSEFAVNEVMLIPTEDENYEAYIEKHGSGNASERIVIEAEHPEIRSSRSVTAFCDKSSPLVSPQADYLQVLNAIGGNTWAEPGQIAEWEFEVKESGYYRLDIKYRQDYTGGMFVTRRLRIDGETPFSEADLIEFPYGSGWNCLTVGEESEPYLFWLEKGVHTVSLEASLGRASQIIREVSVIVDGLNKAYRDIILQTSANPDPYRDYLLDEKIPDTIESMLELAGRLDNVSEELSELTGGRGSENGILERASEQIRRIALKPEKIPSGVSQFQSNISSLGTWILERSKQAMDIDYLVFNAEDAPAEKTDAGFFKGLFYSIKQFLYSFADNYSETDKSDDVLTVWASTGRDQTAIIKNLTEESFITEYGVNTEVKMVQASALLPAVVAGIGPDVVLYADNAEPMNFASRGAVMDLSGFEGFSEVKNRFAKGAFNPYTYGDKVFALPEQQNFPVMFYRTDILEETGIKLPETWDEVYGIITELSKNNMQFGISSAIGGYCMFLYQNGGSLYAEDAKSSGLVSAQALNAFKKWTKFFGEYKLPVSYDFANRFRSGEMPIAIQDYTAYNTLEVFAPEIKGKWSIALVPGTLREDGTIDRSVASGGTSCFILADTKYPEDAWNYISWWTSAEIQSKFGQRVEDKLGAAARYPTANIEAFGELPWSESFYNVINEQWEWVVGTPEVPGGYFTGRHLNNAFRSVVYRNTDSTETLLEYVKVINEEIDEKQRELAENLEG